MRTRSRAQKARERKRRIQQRLAPREWVAQEEPMFRATNVHYDIADRTRAMDYGGIGAIHLMCLRSGLVKAIDDAKQARQSGGLSGTPLYMSPEAIQTPDLVDARSDIYAVGAIGYFLITGQPVFPGISENGGELHKKPYVTGDNVPAENLIVLKPSDIWIIGDSGVRMDLSTEATLEFGTAPTAAGDVPTDQSENPISLFQTDQVAIRMIRDINWQFRRSAAIVVDLALPEILVGLRHRTVDRATVPKTSVDVNGHLLSREEHVSGPSQLRERRDLDPEA